MHPYGSRFSPQSGSAALVLASVLWLPSWSGWATEAFTFDSAFREDHSPAGDDIFKEGGFEVSAGGGALFSTRRHDDFLRFDYSLFDMRCGYMISTPHGEAWWRGNFELLGEAFGGNYIAGHGSYLIGSEAWVRYNFVPAHSRWSPFTQAGFGAVCTDADKEVVGQTFNFVSSLGAGIRCQLSERWALALEYRFQHISNAGLADPNWGITAHGAMLGISRFF